MSTNLGSTWNVRTLCGTISIHSCNSPQVNWNISLYLENIFEQTFFSLRACKSLKSLTLTLDGEERVLTKYQKLKSHSSEPFEYWNYFPSLTLKSFVLQHSSKNKRIYLLKQMKMFIQEIIKRSASSLVCFWSLIPSLDIDARLFKRNEMIAWNHDQIPLPPAIESFVCNWNYLHRHYKPGDVFRPSNMKQIECTFELEVSYWTFLIMAHVYWNPFRRRYFPFFSVRILIWKGWNLTLFVPFLWWRLLTLLIMRMVVKLLIGSY